MYPDERRLSGIEHSHADGCDEHQIARFVHRGIEGPSCTTAVPAMQTPRCLANPDRPTFAIRLHVDARVRPEDAAGSRQALNRVQVSRTRVDTLASLVIPGATPSQGIKADRPWTIPTVS